jgi:hypothetical protein
VRGQRWTLLDEFYRVTFRKRLYGTLEEIQKDLDRFVEDYNMNRPHQGRWCYGSWLSHHWT